MEHEITLDEALKLYGDAERYTDERKNKLNPAVPIDLESFAERLYGREAMASPFRCTFLIYACSKIWRKLAQEYAELRLAE